jgi:hypothetical protein
MFDYVLIDWQRHLIIQDVRSFRAADYNTDLYLVVARGRERLAERLQTETAPWKKLAI